MKNKLITVLAIATLGLSSMNGQTITGFGSGDYGITFGPGSSQTASGTSVTYTDDDVLVNGTVTSLVFSDFATRSLFLTATLTTANVTGFSVELLDSGANSAYYTGTWSAFTVNSAATVTLTYDGAQSVGEFNGTIDKVLFTSASGGGDSISFTLDTLSVVPVPEPSTYAALSGIAVLGFVAYRRRRSAA